MNGFAATVIAASHQRSGGLCERCGSARAVQHHHRRPRGMGGSKRAIINGLANLLHICTACHDWIEKNRVWAKEAGWLLEPHADPNTTPVVYRGVWTIITDDGGLDPVPDAAD